MVTFNINFKSIFEKFDKEITFRRYLDIGGFQDSLLEQLPTSRNPNPSELMTSLRTICSNIIDHFFPEATKKITVSLSAPWYNGACAQAKQTCRRLERLSKRDPSLRQEYLEALKHSATVLRKRKQEYYNQYFEECKDNSRKLFSTVATLTGRVENDQLPELARTSPLEFAEMFNKFLQDKIETIWKELEQLQLPEIIHPPVQLRSILTSFQPISPETFDEIYARTKRTCCEIDPIDFRKVPPLFLKDFFISTINATFKHSEFPESEKKGIIHPKPKSKDVDMNDLLLMLKNQRPITNVSYESKLIETATHDQLNQHVIENGILPPTQSAYRTRHSTESALLRVYNDITTSLDKGLHTIVVYLDMSSAFDSIDHGLLLEDLHNIGVRDQALTLLKSYLENRSVQVAVNGAMSKELPLKFGVPQGSVLGPLLFLIYTRQLSVLLEELGISHHVYADDTQFYISFKDDEVQQVKDTIISTMESINNLLASKKLRLNVSKTDFIIFSPKNKRQDLLNRFGTLKIGDAQLKPSSQVKTLGVIFDSALTFGPHIDSVVKSCNFAIHNLYAARDYISRDTLIASTTHHVLSRIDYCNVLFLNLPDYSLQRLQKIMNRCVRMIYKLSRRDHITPHLKRLHWLPVGPRIDYKLILHTYKALQHDEPKYLRELLNLSERGTLRQPAAPGGHQYTNRTFSHAAPQLYNKLPSSVKCAQSEELFKKRLKTFLFEDAHLHKLKSMTHYTPSNDFLMLRP